MIEIDSIKRSYEFSNDFVFMLDSDLKLYWFNNEAQYKEKRTSTLFLLYQIGLVNQKKQRGLFGIFITTWNSVIILSNYVCRMILYFI